MFRGAMLLSLALTVTAGCPPSNLTPSITVTSGPKLLTITGTGFADVPTCANLALEGLPSPSSNVLIGQAQCSGGSFQNYNWQYDYVGDGCTPGDLQNATVFATDTQGSNAGASQSVSLKWGSNCVVTGMCGQTGQPSCQNGICGAEGQPVCAGNTCYGDLHPTFHNGQLVCSWNCGHAQGAPCPTAGLPFCGGSPSTLEQPQDPCEVPLNGSNLNNGGIFTCYDHGMIDTFGNCTCVPNTLNTCPVNNAIPKPPQPNQGLCIQGQFTDSMGKGCA